MLGRSTIYKFETLQLPHPVHPCTLTHRAEVQGPAAEAGPPSSKLDEGHGWHCCGQILFSRLQPALLCLHMCHFFNAACNLYQSSASGQPPMMRTSAIVGGGTVV
jgi:hypothetical protein